MHLDLKTEGLKTLENNYFMLNYCFKNFELFYFIFKKF